MYSPRMDAEKKNLLLDALLSGRPLAGKARREVAAGAAEGFAALAGPGPEAGLEGGPPESPEMVYEPDVRTEGIHGGWEGKSGKYGPQGLSLKHHAMIDYMLENPAATLEELSQKFQLHFTYVSIIKHSDAFQAELLRRRHAIKVGIVAKVSALAEATTESLLRSVPFISKPETLLEIQKTTMKQLGYGVGNKTVVHGNVGNLNQGVQGVSAETMAEARSRLEERRSQRLALIHGGPSSPPIEGETVDNAPVIDGPPPRAEGSPLGAD